MLNREQEAVGEQLIKLIGTNDIACLSAPAGCGKSYLITKIFEKYSCLFLTPTHASKSVLEKELLSQPMHQHQIRTIHSAVGWRGGRVSPSQPAFEYVQDVTIERNRGMWRRADICILDEASMTTKMLFEALKKYCSSEFHSIPLLLVGDANQLPAVDFQKQINVFKLGFPVHVLTQNMRFEEESGIAQVANIIRRKIDNKNHKKFKIPDLKEWTDVRFLSEDWYIEMKKAYDNKEDACVICFDHKTIDRLRHYLTGRSFGFGRGQIVRCLETKGAFKNGEVLEVIFTDRLSQDIFNIDLKQYYSAKPAWVPIEIWNSGQIPMTYQKIYFGDARSAQVIGNQFTNYAVKNLPKHLDGKVDGFKVRATRSWGLDFTRTAHTSQGKTFDRAFISQSVLTRAGPYVQRSMGDEWLRLLYTSITRARKELILQEYEE